MPHITKSILQKKGILYDLSGHKTNFSTQCLQQHCFTTRNVSSSELIDSNFFITKILGTDMISCIKYTPL